MATASSPRGDAAVPLAGLDLVQAATRRAEAAADEDSAVAALRPLFEDIGWLRTMARSAAARFAQDPMHLFGLTALSSGPLQQLLFVSDARISVTLAILSGDGVPDQPPQLTAFGGNRSLFRSLSPEPLRGRLATLSQADGLCSDEPIMLETGAILDLDESRQSLWIAPSPRQVLFLRARIRRVPAPLVRSQALGATSPSSLANGDDSLARCLALVELLRALGATPPIEALRALLPRAHGRQRWMLMREMLAADTPASWPDLVAMAGRDADPSVRSVAAALIERLSTERTAPCPA